MKKLEPIPLTREYLIQKGRCCGSKCVNCPYFPAYMKGSTDIKK